MVFGFDNPGEFGTALDLFVEPGAGVGAVVPVAGEGHLFVLFVLGNLPGGDGLATHHLVDGFADAAKADGPLGNFLGADEFAAPDGLLVGAVGEGEYVLDRAVDDYADFDVHKGWLLGDTGRIPPIDTGGVPRRFGIRCASPPNFSVSGKAPRLEQELGRRDCRDRAPTPT